MDTYSILCRKLKDKTLNDLDYTSTIRKEKQISDELYYNKECNYKLFFFIVHLQQKIQDLEKENKELKNLLQTYNKETLLNDNKVIKKILLIITFLIFIIIFILF
ncbi:conserved protein, unknown function [Hepatocystis sp. ex Piliocolobus tephrosceles]|nr:conserved protein, unknown function [Hepatocystis sp. ex Piliocolobus tephrosceles]